MTIVARTVSLSHGAWVEARARDDLASFLPMLERVVALSREKGAALAQGGDAYDALLYRTMERIRRSRTVEYREERDRVRLELAWLPPGGRRPLSERRAWRERRLGRRS